MVSKVYNELIIQYSGDNFLHYAAEEEGATLQSSLSQKAAFEGFESGDLQFTRFLNTNTNDHVFTSDLVEIEVLRSNSDFVEEGNVFRLFQNEVDGSQAVHRFFNTETGFHHYSSDSNEIAMIQASNEYLSEGIVGYGGVVDTREAAQVASEQSTINVSNRFDTVETKISGSFNLSMNTIMDFGGANDFNGSVTAMSSTGEELPEYLNFNERSGQVYGYTLKDGIEDNNILVLADDGVSQTSRSFVLSSSDSNVKADADAYTEKSLIASMSVNSNSVGGSFVPTITTNANLTFGAAATASASTNLEEFKLANPTIDGSGTTIAVLDTGIDLDHPFFGPDINGDGISDNIVASADFHGDGNGAQDSDTHGTHVAGIAMSSDATFPGAAPGANVAAIQVLGANGGSFSGIEAGLQWVLDNRATYNITSVNMSLGASDNSTTTQLSSLSDEIAALRSQGVITFVAAGNSFAEFNAQGVGTPASDPNALAISALDNANESAASYSQRDTTLTKVFAPGSGITNAAPGVGATTQTLSGTSMATPYIAGVSSLIKQLNPSLTVDDFEAFLQQSASTFSDPATGGDYRLLDVNALGLLATGATLPDSPTAEQPSTDDHPDSIGLNTELVPGVSVIGDVETGGDKDVYKFSGTAGSTYSVDLRGAPSSLGTLTDPILTILDSNGSQIAQNDDGGNGFESSLTYSPSTSGDFFIEAGAFSRSLTGTYQLDVTDVTLQDDHLDNIGGNAALSVGTNQSGNLEVASDTDVFSLDVEAGLTYTIDQKGFWSSVGNLRDPLLTLKDAAGNVLSQNDDGGFRLESQIVFTPSGSETVYVEAGAFGTLTGTYEISVGTSGSAVGNDVADTPSLGLSSITPGISQIGNLEVGGDKDVFSLSATPGATYQIDMRGSTSNVGTLTDPLLRVLNVNGEVLGQNDDGGRGFESSLMYTASSTGEIFIEAGAFSSALTGTYQIDVLQTSIATSSLGDSVGDTINEASLANLNTIFDGNIDFLGDRDMFRFSLEADTVYRFDIRGSHSNHGTLWDPQAFLYDENNNLVAQDDDSGTGFEASISYTTPNTGDYYLNVMANIGELSQTSGSYSVESIFF
jgi:subtilisin family serine protease